MGQAAIPTFSPPLAPFAAQVVDEDTIRMVREGEHVSLVVPQESDKVPIRAYTVRGPFIPIGLQKTITLPDVGKWLDDLLVQGFTCEPCTLDS